MTRPAALLLALILALTLGACSAEDGPGGSTASLETETTTSTTLEPVGRWDDGKAARDALAPVAAEYPDAVLFVPRELPAGTEVAPGWWPVASAEEPPDKAQWEGNPRVFGGGPQPEVRLALRAGGAWLELLEGFQGDLGNVPGEDTFEVAGREAIVNGMLGGTVIQWSFDDAWFAVFGRGMSRDDVVRVAESMEIFEASTNEAD